MQAAQRERRQREKPPKPEKPPEPAPEPPPPAPAQRAFSRLPRAGERIFYRFNVARFKGE